MQNKISSYKKSKLLLNLKKYSNVAVFNCKEEELLKKNNSLIKSKQKISNKSVNKTNNNINKKQTIDDEFSAYALKTISSFKNSLDSFSTQSTFIKKPKRNSVNSHFQTISNLKMKNNNKRKNKKNIFYLTQNNANNSTIDKDNKEDDDYIVYNNERFNTINYNSQNKKNILYIREKKYGINLLNQIKSFHNKENINTKENEKNLLDIRLKKLNSEKINGNLMLNKVRELKYFIYLNSQRKEVNRTEIENNRNRIEFLKDRINSLNNLKNLYNNRISNKLGEYSKFIINYKEKEKKMNDILINEINRLKKEIKNLQNKISKKEFEKNNILKWVYFLIKMKEKKLILPLYYKKIIEIPIGRKKEKRKTIAPKIDNLKLTEEKNKIFLIRESSKKVKKDSSNKILIHIKLNPLNQIDERINEITHKIRKKYSNKKKKFSFLTKSTFAFKRTSIKSLSSKNNSNDTNIFNFENNFEDSINLKPFYDKLIDDGINISEINRISKYKISLIYKTPQDLEDRLQELQTENIQLLRQYELARQKMFEKNIKLNKLIDDMAENDLDNLILTIEKKEIALIRLKKKNEILKKMYCDSIKNKGINHNIIIKQKKLNYKNKPMNKDTLRKLLFSKVENLFLLCIANLEYPKSLQENKDKSKKDIIYMLTVIEFCIDNLKSKLNFKDKSDLTKYDLMRKIKNDIERRHKIEKGELLRFQEKEKFYNYQETIEEKMNKILFLQKRRIIPVYNLNNMNKKKYYTQKKKLTFEDFMSD